MRPITRGGVREATLLLVALATVATMLIVASSPASASSEGDPTNPPRTQECKVPQALWIVAAEVDPDSLEGCGYFEDPNYHENRKEAGTYNPNGPFSQIFG